MSQHRIILIGGPTASGKSALAMQLAKEKNGNIINADAMQVYAGLPLLTAQPEPADKAQIPHFLYESTDPSVASSAGRWLTQAEATLQQTFSEGRLPILVGGTGLYFDALLGGLAEIPPIPETVRHEAIEKYQLWGEEKFRTELSKRDPHSVARIAPNDKQRLVRAFEVVEHTGKTLNAWHEHKKPSATWNADGNVSIEFHLLMPDRDKLYQNCDKRFLNMIERGAIDEVKGLLERHLPPTLPSMKILGVREIAAYLHGEISLEESVAKAQQATRNYAKRQMTWFRNRWSKTSLIGKESVNKTFH